MIFSSTSIRDVVLIEATSHDDERGRFLETYRARAHAKGGVDLPFVQDNCSVSVRNVLRGLHMQWRKPQGKLVRVSWGAVFDVAVDARPESDTYGQWVGEELSSDNLRQLYLPPGFLHGFCVLSDVAVVEYKCTDYYDPGGEITVRWDDPDIGVDWPVDEPIVSSKDHQGLLLRDLGTQDWRRTMS